MTLDVIRATLVRCSSKSLNKIVKLFLELVYTINNNMKGETIDFFYVVKICLIIFSVEDKQLVVIFSQPRGHLAEFCFAGGLEDAGIAG